jgi:hypothetical protein
MNLIVMDLGSGQFHATLDGEAVEKKQASLKLIDFVREHACNGLILAGEDAHIGVPSNGQSKSQPYTADYLDELRWIVKMVGGEVVLLPQYKTPKVVWDEFKVKGDNKKDSHVVKAWWRHIDKYGITGLKTLPSNLKCQVGIKSRDARNEISFRLNRERQFDYEPSVLSSFTYRLIQRMRVGEYLSDLEKRKLNVDYHIPGGSKTDFEYCVDGAAFATIISIVATVIGDNGKAPERDSWKYVKRFVLKNTAYHQGGGVARSNIQGGFKSSLRRLSREGVVEDGWIDYSKIAIVSETKNKSSQSLWWKLIKRVYNEAKEMRNEERTCNNSDVTVVDGNSLFVDSNRGRLEGLQPSATGAESGSGGRNTRLGGEYFQQLLHFDMDDEGEGESITT